MTTLSDPEGRPTIMDFCREISERIYPVGRLDYLSEGLLIMTNDGEFAHMVAHPSFEINKVYEVKVFGAVNQALLKKLQKGVEIDGQLAKPQLVRIVKQLRQKTWLEFRLQEGRNREIRRICEAAGLTVDKLKRVAIEGLSIEGIAPGKMVYFQKHQLLKLLGMNSDGSKTAKVIKFFSSKKTVKLSKRKNQVQVKRATPADSADFAVFRKENYYETVKALKEKKRLEKEKQRQERKAIRAKKDTFQEDIDSSSSHSK
jgi:23S rRNA pseudouridine2605 synthase